MTVFWYLVHRHLPPAGDDCRSHGLVGHFGQHIHAHKLACTHARTHACTRDEQQQDEELEDRLDAGIALEQMEEKMRGVTSRTVSTLQCMTVRAAACISLCRRVAAATAVPACDTTCDTAFDIACACVYGPVVV